MSSLEEVIQSEDPELIKTRRDAIQDGMSSIEKSLGRLLARRASKLDQGKILRLHKAYLHYGMDDDIEEEFPEFQEEMKLYSDVKDGF